MYLQARIKDIKDETIGSTLSINSHPDWQE